MAIMFYDSGESSIGSILVANTLKGARFITIGDTPMDNEAALHMNFPAASLVASGGPIKEMLDKVLAFVETPKAPIDVELDLQGTEFQLSVWDALLKIPSGITYSYTEIADQIGAPKAARAVANSCASNLLALAVPCHRVIASNGAIAGYRWGEGRKQALLAKEAALRDA